MSHDAPEPDAEPERTPAWPHLMLVALCVFGGALALAMALRSGHIAAGVVIPILFAAVYVTHRFALRSERVTMHAEQEHLRTLSVQDEATGSHNKTGLYLLGNQMLETVRRKGDAVHAFVADTSHMTKERLPLDSDHSAQVMQAVAAALKSSVRGTDVVARWDAHQFVIMGPGTGVHPGELERRVRAHLTEGPSVAVDNWPCRITVGQASLAPWDGGDLDTLFDKAQQDFKMRQSMRSPAAPEAFFTGSNTPKTT